VQPTPTHGLISESLTNEVATLGYRLKRRRIDQLDAELHSTAQ
jgi:hypothetical protein